MIALAIIALLVSAALTHWGKGFLTLIISTVLAAFGAAVLVFTLFY